jgi:sterol desaturase/sphingolipid hydroxylase (fatty acid hydroxylase superfamily)
MSHLIYFSIPAFIITMVVEGLYLRHARKDEIARARLRGYELRDTRTSLIMGLGNVFISTGSKILLLGLWVWIYEHRLFTVPTTVAGGVLLFFAEDFCYYLFHRTSHEVRLFWAAHENHHSSTHYNLSTALRQSWSTPFTAIPFWLPLPLLGFDPALILSQQAFSLLYQYWLHTEVIGTMGPLEWIVNTPSHHRVHHGSDVEYLDRNHAGILIIWDRLFGTFAKETYRPNYGLTKNLDSFNPLTVAFHEYVQIFRDVRGARGLREAFMFVFGPPGWSPDGSRQTSKQMRAAYNG